MDTRIGTVLENRYRIERKIATGGMSVVYAGERIQLGRPVAIKFLHPKLCQDEKFLKRFEREAKAMSQLSHPNCISVIDFGIADAPYLVMELVTGKTLKKVLKNGPMNHIRVMQIARQVLAGLSHAHKQGIVHRDIKPGNILLTEADCSGEHVMVFDFGLAKHLGVESEDLTGKGIVAGTAEYLAPENTGRDGGKIVLDARTDLFSVGVVAFELLTGIRPFKPPTPMEIWRMHDEPPLTLAQAYPEGNFSESLEKIIAKALARNPAKRYQTAEEFVAKVDQYLEQEGAPIRSVPPPAADSTSDNSSLTPVVEENASRKKSLLLLAIPVIFLAIIAFGIGMALGTRKDQAKKQDLSDDVTTKTIVHHAPLTPRKNIDSPSAGEQGNAPEGDKPQDSPTADANPLPKNEIGAPPEPGEPIQTAKENDPEEMAFAMYLIGEGQIDRAVKKLKELQAKYPRDGQLYLLLGNLYAQQKMPRVALENYRLAIKQHRSFSRNKILLGNTIQFLAITPIHEEVALFIQNEIGKPAKPALERALDKSQSPQLSKRISNVLGQLSQTN